MKPTFLFAAAMSCAVHLGCASTGSDEPDAPVYVGALPGARGHLTLSELVGKTFVDSTGAFGGGEWTVGRFAVIANPVTQRGPVVTLSRGGEERFLPIETDGDVADFASRVTGERSPWAEGRTSVAYRNVLKLPDP